MLSICRGHNKNHDQNCRIKPGAWGSAAGALSRALFPRVCTSCGRLIDQEALGGSGCVDKLTELSAEQAFFMLMSSWLCCECISDFEPVGQPRCSRCAEPFKTGIGKDHLCGRCLTTERYFSRAEAPALYRGAMLSVIHAFKYRGMTGLADPLAALLYLEFLDRFSGQAPDVAMPVPLHEKRIKSRGYNQAALLIRRWPKLAQQTNILEARKIRIETDALERSKNTPPQTGLDKAGRMKNLKNAFTVKRPEKVNGNRILLVDDVFTTGSTAEECARSLSRAGAAGVYVLTLARAV